MSRTRSSGALGERHARGRTSIRSAGAAARAGRRRAPTGADSPHRPLTPQMLALIAERFKALGEPARLQILHTLRRGEMTVSELVKVTGLAQANVSKHLQLLYVTGFVRRRKEGLFTYYGLADEGVLRLCEIMCGRLDAELEARHRVLGA